MNSIDIFVNDLQLNILNLLESKDLIRSEIVEILKEPRSTIFDNLTELIKLKIIKSHKVYMNKVGRPPVSFSLIKNYKIVLNNLNNEQIKKIRIYN